MTKDENSARGETGVTVVGEAPGNRTPCGPISRTFESVLDPADLAAALAHRGCCGTEHDPANGKLHGCCVVCGVPWPCETAQYFLRPKR